MYLLSQPIKSLKRSGIMYHQNFSGLHYVTTVSNKWSATHCLKKQPQVKLPPPKYTHKQKQIKNCGKDAVDLFKLIIGLNVSLTPATTKNTSNTKTQKWNNGIVLSIAQQSSRPILTWILWPDLETTVAPSGSKLFSVTLVNYLAVERLQRETTTACWSPHVAW
jgi:hypothetical protein